MSLLGDQETLSGGLTDRHLTSSTAEIKEFVSFLVGQQMFGIPVQQAQEVLTAQRVTPAPLAPPEVGGLLNLRGQIVIAVNMRARMGLPSRDKGVDEMNIVVEDGGELFSLQVDEVGDVIAVAADICEAPPATLDDRWRRFCSWVYRLDHGLLVELDVPALLEMGR